MKIIFYELMKIKYIGMSYEMKEKIGRLLTVAPWRELNLYCNEKKREVKQK